MRFAGREGSRDRDWIRISSHRQGGLLTPDEWIFYLQSDEPQFE